MGFSCLLLFGELLGRRKLTFEGGAEQSQLC